MSKKIMTKNTDKQAIDNLADNFNGYAALLRKIKQRVLVAQQRAIYAANEEMLRMYWDIGGMLQQSQDADGWGKKTLQRLSVDLKNDYSEIKGFSVRNMQCMIQFFNEYNQELTMVKGADSSMKVCRNTRCAFFFFIDYKNRLIFLSCDILRISLIYAFSTSK